MLRLMQREVDWIVEALRRNPAKTKSGLARALGIDKSGVTRLLNGARRLKYSEAEKAAQYLGCAPGGFAEAAEPYVAEFSAPLRGAPLFSARSDTEGFWLLDRTTPIEVRPAAPQFAGAALVFGFYAPDGAMEPRFRTGEIVWVNPSRAAATGADALLAPRDFAEKSRVFLAVLEASSTEGMEVRQHGAERRFFARSQWQAFYVFDRQ